MKTEKNISKIYYRDLFGIRKSKYDYLWNNDIVSIDWIELNPEDENCFFSNKNFTHKLNYDYGLKLQEIFSKNKMGVITKRDSFIIDFEKSNLIKRIKDFLNKNISDEDINKKYGISSTYEWNMGQARKKLSSEGLHNHKIIRYLYRPFDFRYIYYEGIIIARDVREIMTNLLSPNIALNCMRQFYGDEFCHIFLSDFVSDINYLTSARGQYVFPLYLYSESSDSELSGNNFLFQEQGKKDNFTTEFREYIKSKYKKYYAPEQILGYIYAVLHSPTYREKYIEFLKIDFPRVPFTDDEEMFQKLSELGTALIDAHLLKDTVPKNIECRCIGEGNNFKVEKVEYTPLPLSRGNTPLPLSRGDTPLPLSRGEKTFRVYINENRYFESVPPEIWNFHIGGYQVLDKWLKERKKHEITLSCDDIQHFIKVVNVLDFTIKTMKKIDELTREWV